MRTHLRDVDGNRVDDERHDPNTHYGWDADKLEEDRRRLMEDEDRNRYVTDWLS